MVVPESDRRTGIGSAVMRDLTAWADRTGSTLALSPTNEFGASITRLRSFYRNFGFRPNTGRNRDYSISESMVRPPAQAAAEQEGEAQPSAVAPPSETSVVDVPTLNPGDSNLTERASELYDERVRGTQVRNPYLGATIESPRTAARKIVSGGRSDPRRLSVMGRLPEIAEYAIPIGREPDRRSRNNVEGFTHAVAPVRVNGEVYAVRLILRNSDAGQGPQPRMYEIAGYDWDPQSNGPLDAGRSRQDSATFESVGPSDSRGRTQGDGQPGSSSPTPFDGSEGRRSSAEDVSVGRPTPAAGSEGAVDQARSPTDDMICVERLMRAVNERPPAFSRAEPDETLAEARRRAGLGGSRGNIRAFANRLQQLTWDQAKGLMGEGADRLAQGGFDRFHGIKRIENRLVGNLPAEQSGYVAARLSTGSSSIMRGLLEYGSVEWRDGVLSRVEGSKGLLDILDPVKGELDTFLGWLVARRAQRPSPAASRFGMLHGTVNRQDYPRWTAPAIQPICPSTIRRPRSPDRTRVRARPRRRARPNSPNRRAPSGDWKRRR